MAGGKLVPSASTGKKRKQRPFVQNSLNDALQMQVNSLVATRLPLGKRNDGDYCTYSEIAAMRPVVSSCTLLHWCYSYSDVCNWH